MTIGPAPTRWLSNTPDADEARRWAEQELTKSEYLAAQPTAFDRASLAVIEYFEKLLNPDIEGGSGGVVLLVILGLVILAALVVGVLLWGKPRPSRRIPPAQMMLGESDHLTADELRRRAERSARAGEWGNAMTQRYRALARGLIERDLLDPAPGATAQAIASDTARAFPGQRQSLLEAATLFDAVRYLGKVGDEAGYVTISEADNGIAELSAQVPA